VTDDAIEFEVRGPLRAPLTPEEWARTERWEQLELRREPDGGMPPSATRLDHSWRAIDLVAAAANPPEPPAIGGLLYPGKRTLLSGETEALKTWLALILCKAEMDAGYPAAWVDLDAMGKGEILARLRALGVPDALISQLFLYFEPDQRLADAALEEVVAEISERQVRFFVIDAFNPMLSLHGLDPHSTPDVETFWREVAQPIANVGAAPSPLDHVVKNSDNRGRYAYGSERKASGAHVHIGFRIVEPFGRGETGRALLTTHKDRAGFLPRPAIGVLELVSNGDQVSYSLAADKSRTGDKFRPTFLMERVSEYLASADGGVSKRNITEAVQGKAAAVRTAVDVLIEEGYAAVSEGPKRAHLVEFVRFYRESDDTFEPEESSASPVRPQCVPGLVSTALCEVRPASPLIRDADALAGGARPGSASLADELEWR
jgi:AAA domain-containing protein